MRVLTIEELMRMTKTELLTLERKIRLELPALPEGSPERTNARINLHNIRWVLARCAMSHHW